MSKQTLRTRIAAFLSKQSAPVTSKTLAAQFGSKGKTQLTGMYITLKKMRDDDEVTVTNDPAGGRGKLYASAYKNFSAKTKNTVQVKAQLVNKSGQIKTQTYRVAVPNGLGGPWGNEVLASNTSFEQFWANHRVVRVHAAFGELPQAVQEFEAKQKELAFFYFSAGYGARSAEKK